jgi:hypothetical protein
MEPEKGGSANIRKMAIKASKPEPVGPATTDEIERFVERAFDRRYQVGDISDFA